MSTSLLGERSAESLFRPFCSLVYQLFREEEKCNNDTLLDDILFNRLDMKVSSSELNEKLPN